MLLCCPQRLCSPLWPPPSSQRPEALWLVTGSEVSKWGISLLLHSSGRASLVPCPLCSPRSENPGSTGKGPHPISMPVWHYAGGKTEAGLPLKRTDQSVGTPGETLGTVWGYSSELLPSQMFGGRRRTGSQVQLVHPRVWPHPLLLRHTKRVG